MQGTVTFPWADIDVNDFEFQVQGVEDDCSQDSTVDFRQILRTEVNLITNCIFVLGFYKMTVTIPFLSCLFCYRLKEMI